MAIVLVCGDPVVNVVAYNTRSPLILIRGTMSAQQSAHDILQLHMLSLMKRLPGAIFFNKTRLCLTRQWCHKTMSALLLPFLVLPDPQKCLKSSISGNIWDDELVIARV
ncbi:uncharacterized protein TNCV_1290471 [Trichonephila clavipes]|nr:uncharacterized protein TNCV_1290471 [Trichonephila clavipes]